MIKIGERNNKLSALAEVAFADGKSEDEVLNIISQTNKEACVSPLPDAEITNIVKCRGRK